MKQTDSFLSNGFVIFDEIYTMDEVENVLRQINLANSDKDTFRKSEDLFAIRQFLKEVPSAIDAVFNDNLKAILSQILGDKYFVVKSIYFDKPQTSNWYVSYHQDLTISVDKKVSLNGFDLWTTKQNQFAVQPPLNILQNVVTVRIHLDDTDENNGALRVIPKSHLKGVYRPETIDWTFEKEVSCNVSKGGIMLMKPLLLHSSGRTTNNRQRRVIHIEFSNQELPTELNWAERINLC
ncbi:phytanoyl-CoA dioxygenase family protein [Niastella populi]|uniref:Phytanoyl-CoA dioxygenase n=1 Tax=Niastella populi TaxID=550983 RepID=A0A1V9GD62_9BACT|nr:phytanoyl-CoA dioxygenase family protein [Niastella populi]OQP68477.1 phytanoyl-CoA dioxygenase [Niastella populi]